MCLHQEARGHTWEKPEPARALSPTGGPLPLGSLQARLTLPYFWHIVDVKVRMVF